MEDEDGGTDTQMIMDTDSADAVGEVPDEEGNNIYIYNILCDVIMIV